MLHRKNGFTLIEMMIVVALIAAIAIPNLLRSRLQANEASAASDLRTICVGQISCSNARLTFGDFALLVAETDGRGTSFVDTTWYEGRVKAGYSFSMAEANANAVSFTCLADPVSLGVTGSRFFRIDGSGVVRFDATGRPAPNAPSLNSGA